MFAVVRQQLVRCLTVRFAEIRLRVSSLTDQRAVESLDLAVDLRLVHSDGTLTWPFLLQGIVERVRAVAGVVVGQHCLNRRPH